jgi:predicted anti-sigma-YlaC factor YlaD
MNVPMVPSDDCRRAQAAVSARLDGELSQLGEARLTAHLRTCPACTAYAFEAAAVATRMRQAPLERPDRPIEIRRRRSVGASAAAAVAVAAAAAIAVGTIHPAGSGQDSGVQTASGVALRQIQSEHRLVATLSSLNAPAPQGRLGRAMPV